MGTMRDIAQASLEEIGAYGPGETMNDADAERVLDQCNKMLDLWSNTPLMCFAISDQSVVLQVNKSQYTIGTSGGADIALARPRRLIEGPGAAFLIDSNNVRYPVDVYTQDQWNQIGQLTVTSQIPTTIFFDPQYPLGIINVFPTPSLANTLHWNSYLALTTLADLDASIILPPGYEDLIQHHLAIRAAPFFKNAVVSADIRALASESKRIIKRVNKRTPHVNYEREIVSRASPTYNIFRDRGGS